MCIPGGVQQWCICLPVYSPGCTSGCVTLVYTRVYLRVCNTGVYTWVYLRVVCITVVHTRVYLRVVYNGGLYPGLPQGVYHGWFIPGFTSGCVPWWFNPGSPQGVYFSHTRVYLFHTRFTVGGQFHAPQLFPFHCWWTVLGPYPASFPVSLLG